jgi:hypothetical protein
MKHNKNIKIISGYSEKGGSTTALINLTNNFNKIGYDCTFYGPQNWHLDKCKSGLMSNLTLDSNDIIITHFIKFHFRPMVKKVLYVCHEKWWWSFKNVTQYWDECIFLHDEHRNFHQDYKGKFRIIPNLKENLTPKDKPELDLVAGIIGAIEDRKQTHISIQRALNDNCEKVLLFGSINDQNYYKNNVEIYLKDDRIKLMGHSSNKQEMYDSIGRVYHTSKGEVACLVKDECYLTNTKFFGNDETNNEVSKLNNDEILKLWINALDL